MSRHISALTRKSIADVTRRKGRTLIAILGILIGVAGLTVITMFQETYFSALAFTNQETNQSDITFTIPGVDPALAPTLARVPNVSAILIHSFYLTEWHISQAPGSILFVIIAHPDLAHSAVNTFQLNSGRYPGQGEIMLENGDRGIQNFTLGDTITIDTPHGSTNLRVVGTARTPGGGNPVTKGSAIAYMSSDALAQITGNPLPNIIQVRVKDKNQEDLTVAALSNVLKEHHVTISDTAVHSDSVGSNGLLNNLFNLLRLLSAFAILVACFLIINTVTTLIAEQTNIIGTMKALGGSQAMILRSYLLSVGIYTLFGTVLGLFAGIGGGYFLASKLANIHNLDLNPFFIPPDVLVYSLAAGLLAPLLAALYPLWKGTRITVREAISAYGVSNTNEAANRSRWQQYIADHTMWIPQTIWLGLRNTFRKRGRAYLTLLALALSGTTFLAISTANYSINQQVAQRYNAYHFDIKLNMVVPEPVNFAQFRSQLLSTPDVRDVERSSTQKVSTQWGNLDLTCLEENTHLYQASIVSGRWFHPNEANVLLISDDAARSSGLTVGNTITFSYGQHLANWHIIGIVHDPNVELGSFGSAITTVNNFYRFNGFPTDVGIEFLLQAQDHSQQSVNQLAAHLTSTLNVPSLRFSVSTAQQVIFRAQQGFQDLYTMFYAVAVVIGIVGILGLYNTLTSSVLERRREIGILRSMGGSSGRIASVFWAEGLMLGIVAWIAGIILGIPLAYGFLLLLEQLLLHAPFVFDATLLFIMLAVILCIAIVATLLPTLRATRIRIVETLRYE